MRALVRQLLLALALAVGTWTLGWWAVPAIGAAWGWLERGRAGRFGAAAIAAALAWALLLAWDAVRGDVGGAASALGGAFGAPGWLLALVTLAFAALLAGCAAQVAGAFAAPVQRTAADA